MSAVTMNFIDEAWVVVVTENDETYTRIFKAREFAENYYKGQQIRLGLPVAGPDDRSDASTR
jgi:hypothetical protein